MNKTDASSPCNPFLGQRDREISLKSPWQNLSEEWRGDCEYPIHSQTASSQKNNSVKTHGSQASSQHSGTPGETGNRVCWGVTGGHQSQGRESYNKLRNANVPQKERRFHK